MILKSRLFERVKPTKEAKSIYIFCEGVKREKDYFEYFKQIDSRINIEVYPLHASEDNSPKGLLNIAQSCIISSKENENPKYEMINELDEVWIVIDIDKDKDESRKPQIEQINDFCHQFKDWFVATSNPCFEVWLYYHKFENKPEISNDEICTKWKEFVNNLFAGGFDSRRHPSLIKKAIDNSKSNFTSTDLIPDYACTDVYKLAESIYSLVKNKISKALLIFKNDEYNKNTHNKQK